MITGRLVRVVTHEVIPEIGVRDDMGGDHAGDRPAFALKHRRLVEHPAERATDVDVVERRLGQVQHHPLGRDQRVALQERPEARVAGVALEVLRR
jgi:hypothetical protein